MAEVPQSETRRLSAIMFTDIVGFSRQMGVDETRMLRLLEVHNQLIHHAVTTHHGTVIKTVGDAFLVDFPSVVHAVQCAQAIQTQFRTHNMEKEQAEQIHVRIGIHLGDIVERDGDVFGDGVNIAARLQGLAEPDTICISDVVYRDVAKKLDVGTVVPLGKPKLKNIAERFVVYALLPEAPKGLGQNLNVQRLKLSRRVRPVHWLSVAGLLLVVITLITVRYLPFLHLLLSPPQPFAPSTEATLPPLPLPDKPSIVVLPFANMSDDPSQDYFSDGITEDITTDLSRLSSLFVISRNTAFVYKGKAVKLSDLSKELGVQYVLEGSVRRADNQVRITTQLIDARQDRHVWAERYDRPLQDIFALQDEIVRKIVTTLKLQLTLMEQGVLVRKRTDNLEAYDLYLRGLETVWRAYYGTKKDANEQARQLLEKAIAVDPSYAEAYTGLGMTYFLDGFYRWNPGQQSFERAHEQLQKAVALDDTLPQAHRILGGVYVWQKQHERAIAEAQRAITLDPNDADGYETLGAILTWAGQPKEAIGLIEKAMRLNPRYPPMYVQSLSFSYRLAGQYEEAIALSKKLLIRTPHFVPAHLQLANCYAQLGRLEEARAEATAVMRLMPRYSLEIVRQNIPFKDPVVLEREIDAWRKAGLK
ncbi:MAG: adenylate/guanylate cyclase domain-containing protein [Deltaproteobacteria bacterium]|nr:adenylate/guanylate cyclase domain-containing protein [Deltaproteobacteria bacterium]